MSYKRTRGDRKHCVGMDICHIQRQWETNIIVFEWIYAMQMDNGESNQLRW